MHWNVTAEQGEINSSILAEHKLHLRSLKVPLTLPVMCKWPSVQMTIRLTVEFFHNEVKALLSLFDFRNLKLNISNEELSVQILLLHQEVFYLDILKIFTIYPLNVVLHQ